MQKIMKVDMETSFFLQVYRDKSFGVGLDICGRAGTRHELPVLRLGLWIASSKVYELLTKFRLGGSYRGNRQGFGGTY